MWKRHDTRTREVDRSARRRAYFGAGASGAEQVAPPGRVSSWETPATRPPRSPRRGVLIRLLLGVIALALLATLARGLVFAAAVSTEPLTGATFWPATARRQANVLVLGYGGQGHQGTYLTDSLLLLSADLETRRAAQISVPRDLWVQVPPDSGQYAKLNTAYEHGYYAGGESIAAGGRMATLKVAQVTGLPVDRWVTIDFRGFRALVDALGGVEVEVERAFTADYPANDDPTIDASWTKVRFEAGRQRMDGETAIRYARARYADVPEEAGDFARSQRQQRLTRAIAAQLKSPTSWWRAFAVLDALQPALRTNLAPFDLLILFLRADPGGGARIVLDDGNVLEHGLSDDGQAILLPRDGDYSLITRYIRERFAALEQSQ